VCVATLRRRAELNRGVGSLRFVLLFACNGYHLAAHKPLEQLFSTVAMVTAANLFSSAPRRNTNCTEISPEEPLTFPRDFSRRMFYFSKKCSSSYSKDFSVKLYIFFIWQLLKLSVIYHYFFKINHTKITTSSFSVYIRTYRQAKHLNRRFAGLQTPIEMEGWNLHALILSTGGRRAVLSSSMRLLGAKRLWTYSRSF
jgi:hypothetical protein